MLIEWETERGRKYEEKKENSSETTSIGPQDKKKQGLKTNY